jgi:hypothetical protein
MHDQMIVSRLHTSGFVPITSIPGLIERAVIEAQADDPPKIEGSARKA